MTEQKTNAWVLSQDAELRLRGGVRVRVTWPPTTTAADDPALLVFVGAAGDAALCRELAVRTPAVVLAVAASGVDAFAEAREVMEWGADHAAELGADPQRVMLAAEHRGAQVLAALARHARDRGWPPIAGQFLIPCDMAPAGVAELVRFLQAAGIDCCGNAGGMRPA